MNDLGAGAPVGRVVGLWRYPVKSMGGQGVESALLDERGLHGDRLWAVRDLEDDRTGTARRMPALLRCTARYAEEPDADAGPGRATPVLVTLPDGEELAGDDPRLDERLSDLVGRRVAMTPLPPASATAAYGGGLRTAGLIRRELGIPDGEPLPDASAFSVRTLATLARFSTPPGQYADLAPVHLLTTTSLASAGRAAVTEDVDQGDPDAGGGLAVRRFRPTLLVEVTDPGSSGTDYPESDWVGGAVTAGDAALEVTMPTVRCTIPTHAQPDLPRRRAVSRALAEQTDRFLGVYTDVTTGGQVSVGDEVLLRRVEAGPVRAAVETVRAKVLRAGSRLLP